MSYHRQHANVPTGIFSQSSQYFHVRTVARGKARVSVNEAIRFYKFLCLLHDDQTLDITSLAISTRQCFQHRSGKLDKRGDLGRFLENDLCSHHFQVARMEKDANITWKVTESERKDLDQRKAVVLQKIHDFVKQGGGYSTNIEAVIPRVLETEEVTPGSAPITSSESVQWCHVHDPYALVVKHNEASEVTAMEVGTVAFQFRLTENPKSCHQDSTSCRGESSYGQPKSLVNTTRHVQFYPTPIIREF